MNPALILIGMFALGSQNTPATLQTQPAPSLARVYVHTDETGDAFAVKARRESVKDLSGALAGKMKRLVLVQDEDHADVVLDVIDRGVTIPRVVIGIGARPGQPPDAGVVPTRVAHLRVELTCGLESVELTNKNAPIESNAGWKYAADDIAKQVDKWIGDHSEQVLAAKEAAASRQKAR
jgi:hypothetical protein